MNSKRLRLLQTGAAIITIILAVKGAGVGSFRPLKANADAETELYNVAAEASVKEEVVAEVKTEDKDPVTTETKPEDKEQATTEAKSEDKDPATTEVKTEDKTPATTETKPEDKTPSITETNHQDKTTEEKKEDKAPEKVVSKPVVQKNKLKPLETETDDLEKREVNRDSLKVKPIIYKDHRSEMKKNKETINGFTYFNQTDPCWNDNGYQISHSGCGPTSMAVVITSLTDKWVTPVDTTAWAYAHRYYSAAGSVHSLIPALADKYGLNCKGVGRDKNEIRAALKKGNPVVCLMGPGHFTHRGHFMVLVDIDKNDMVAVADVASRNRSNYKYALSDIVGQSKNASAGGPFWVISKTDAGKNAVKGKTKDKNVEKVEEEKQSAVTYQVLKNDSETNIELSMKDGKTLMILTDQKLIDGKDFVYLVNMDGKGIVTVIDSDYKNMKQCTLSEIMQHRKSDLTGISTWEVNGAKIKNLMPLSGKKTKLEEQRD